MGEIVECFFSNKKACKAFTFHLYFSEYGQTMIACIIYVLKNNKDSS